MRTYFSGREKPSEPLLRLKLKELVVSILTGGSNRALAGYFQFLSQGDGPSVAEIMEANFRFNLSLDEYAALCHRSLSSFKRDFQEFHPIFNVIVTVAMPLIMSVYVGIAEKAAREAIDFARRQRHLKPHVPDVVGGMLNQLASAEVHLRDMIRLANELDFQPENQTGQDVLSRKTNVANACVSVVTRAMEIVGGQGFYRSFGLERLFRDVQAAKYHPLPESEQQRALGEFVIGQRLPVREPVLVVPAEP